MVAIPEVLALVENHHNFGTASTVHSSPDDNSCFVNKINLRFLKPVVYRHKNVP